MRESAAAVAKTLGMTPAELMTALRSGQTLKQIAATKGVSTDTLVKAMVAAAEQQLATAVQNNRITQAQADTIKSTLTQRMTDLVNGTLPKRGPGFGGPGRWGGPGTTPQSPSTPSGSTGTAGTTTA
jgi:antitoxin component of RelBE/YafQ-DinJ toxin-antitoxin module